MPDDRHGSSSSRTLPGHGYRRGKSSVSGVTLRTSLPRSLLKRRTKWSVKSGRSSMHSPCSSMVMMPSTAETPRESKRRSNVEPIGFPRLAAFEDVFQNQRLVVLLVPRAE